MCLLNFFIHICNMTEFFSNLIILKLAFYFVSASLSALRLGRHVDRDGGRSYIYRPMGLLRGCLTVFLVGALVSSGAAAKEAAYGGGAEVEAMVFIDAAKLEVEENTYRDNGEVVTARVVRRVKPFSIDTAPVTNAEFVKFVDATSYATTAEIAGWSLVLDSLIEATGTMDGASPSGCVAVLCAATHTSSSPLAARPSPSPLYQPIPPSPPSSPPRAAGTTRGTGVPLLGRTGASPRARGRRSRSARRTP